ncbi:hypothetical protein GQ600_24908 [Phytophthora cactorum]|nr:hypothetical protein GQ600_24908 [Phytophthora cactorum]
MMLKTGKTQGVDGKVEYLDGRFCQFQDLPDEPTEETLWQLLSRRAAGVFHPMQSDHTEEEEQEGEACGIHASLRCVCQPLQGPEDRPRAWSFLSSTASACLENIVNSAWWDVEERVRSDLENATSPTHRLRELLESTRHSIPFKRRVKGKKRKRKRSTGFTKGINEKKRKL